MPVGGIHDQGVSAAGQKGLGAFQRVGSDADGCCHAQAAVVVLAGIGILLDLVDVLDGDKALQVLVLVNHQKLFYTVLMQVALGFLKGCAKGHGHKIFGSHDFLDLYLGAVLDKSHVAVCQDADKLSVIDNRQAGDAEVMHQLQGFAHGAVGIDGHGIQDHA